MNNVIKGKAFVLGDNIDTDQIIPAQHLVYSLDDPEESKQYGKYAFSGVPSEESGLPAGGVLFTPEEEFRSEFSVVIAGKNFGCGSSREHAPAAMQIAGIQAVIATTYARIFYRNAVDGGFLIPYESNEDLSQLCATGDEIEINVAGNTLMNRTTGVHYSLKSLGGVADIVRAGGIFDYARQKGMMS